jgi:hypothetical protein
MEHFTALVTAELCSPRLSRVPEAVHGTLHGNRDGPGRAALGFPEFLELSMEHFTGIMKVVTI